MAVSKDEIDIVLERLRSMPRTVTLNIGSHGSFTRDQMVKEVSNRTKIGELIVQMQMSYLRSFKERVNR